MPTYEYECPACGVFEEFQRMTDEPLKKCPQCGKKVSRLFGTGAGLIFKGSGFYQTDFKNSGKPAPKAPACPSGGDCKSCPKSSE